MPQKDDTCMPSRLTAASARTKGQHWRQRQLRYPLIDDQLPWHYLIGTPKAVPRAIEGLVVLV